MLDLTSLDESVSALRIAIEKATDPRLLAMLDESTIRVLRSGVVQHFEFTYELCWKFVKRFLSANTSAAETDGLTRRELYRRAAEYLLIADTEQWMLFHKVRNLTAHTYNQSVADEVNNLAPSLLSAAEHLLAQLKRRND